MWIFLSESFLSIVDKGDETHRTLLVRARRKGDIERVFPGAKVSNRGGTDYAYRARIERRWVAERIAEEISSIRYGNFKLTVGPQGRHSAYYDVWEAMARYQREAED